MWIFILGILLGVVLGRVYGWMKYHYPEFQEEIKLKVARKRLLRTRIEAEIEASRLDVDRLLEARMKG